MNYKLCSQIRTLREARKMNQVELGKRLGVSKQSICNWENDYVQPSIEMLVRMATLFSVSTDYLLGFERDPNAVTIDVSGLPVETIAHVQQIVDDLRGNAP